jgi:5-formyltetrahydrofolate cyclo-ligase
VAQKGRKNAVIVSFLLDVPTLALIDQIVEDSKQWKLPLDGRSDWIKRAIRRELDHRQRSRRRKTHGPEIPVAAQLPRASVASEADAAGTVAPGGEGSAAEQHEPALLVAVPG